MVRTPLAHLKSYLAEQPPSKGGPWLGRDPRQIPLPDWQAAKVTMPTLAEAARAKCLDCCGGQLREVRSCMALACPLWPFRMGSDPFRGIRGTPVEIGSRRPISDPSGGISGGGSDTTEPAV